MINNHHNHQIRTTMNQYISRNKHSIIAATSFTSPKRVLQKAMVEEVATGKLVMICSYFPIHIFTEIFIFIFICFVKNE